MSFNIRLKEIIEKDYTSQVQLANELGVSKAVITKYLNTDRKPNFEMLEKFYNIGYNINWLISGRGVEKRHLINREELDEYDRVVFGIDELGINTEYGLLRPIYGLGRDHSLNDKVEIEELITSSIKRFYYINNSYNVLLFKLSTSKYTKFLKNKIIFDNNSTFFTLVEAPIMELINNNNNFEEFEPIEISIPSYVNKSLLIKNLSAYLFILTELDYYKKSIGQYEKVGQSESISAILSILSRKLGDNLAVDMNKLKISFKELKERFVLLSNIFDNESYLESKSLIFSGMIDKIFKIVQLNN